MGEGGVPELDEPDVPGLHRAAAGLRALQDAFAAASPPPGTWSEVARRLEGLTAALVPHAGSGDAQLGGRLRGEPGRGQALVPPLLVDAVDGERASARVTFGAHYVGVGAVHGGALPLVFDELLGRVAHASREGMARTAFLKVDYRSLTPWDRELVLTAALEREEGRKRWVRGWLHDGERLCAEAEALFVTVIRP